MCFLYYNLSGCDTMFRRKITRELEEWKESLRRKKKALVIKGLRQVGKTTVVLDFGEANYKNIIYLNFLDNPSLKNIFSDDLNVDTLVKKMSIYFPCKNFEAFNTVKIYDEVQECSNARYSVKPFMLDGRFDIIETGSLLGFRGYNQSKVKIPTGFEHIIKMYAMDF